MKTFSLIVFLFVAIIHFLPVSGIIGAEQLSKLYGISLTDESTVLLMRHRAILFSLVGIIFIFASFKIEIRFIAYLIGFISMISFCFLYMGADLNNPSLKKVFIVDLIAIIALLISAIFEKFACNEFLGFVKQ